MLLAKDWSGQDLTGWLASEKLNGCRVEWDGSYFWTRHGNRVNAPAWFTKGLPRCRVNGEIHAGRGVGFGNNNSAYKVASNAVRLGGNWFDEMDGGEPLRFTALYLSGAPGNWHARQLAATAIKGCRHADAVETRVLSQRGDLVRFMSWLRKIGAEGGMFVNPNGGGNAGRTGDLLRWKFLKD